MKMTKKKEIAGKQCEEVLPKIIADWVRGLGDGLRSERYRARAKRFIEFAEKSSANSFVLASRPFH